MEISQELLQKKEALERVKKEIEKRYTHPMPGYGGSIIRRSAKEAFSREVKELERQLADFQAYVRHHFKGIVEDNKARLVDLLTPAVLNRPPAKWRHQLVGPERTARAKMLIHGALQDAFKNFSLNVDGMRVRALLRA
ncbi:hypothetical protein NXS98_07280 [Fontisphaera persica]|uniref:hypothetical protein n=1 Tax=Fontisphaera persica TaxID=2974023 RepID=UPI0024C0945F|nr:hypothetical protein [Fontisphaera persica]WCJ60914.1 hypothetical protein NXS98_07280 [Fontisphaera persica]